MIRKKKILLRKKEREGRRRVLSIAWSHHCTIALSHFCWENLSSCGTFEEGSSSAETRQGKKTNTLSSKQQSKAVIQLLIRCFPPQGGALLSPCPTCATPSRWDAASSGEPSSTSWLCESSTSPTWCTLGKHSRTATVPTKWAAWLRAEAAESVWVSATNPRLFCCMRPGCDSGVRPHGKRGYGLVEQCVRELVLPPEPWGHHRLEPLPR